jgi:CubicO group peptidase (beta-lactamase class C family)
MAEPLPQRTPHAVDQPEGVDWPTRGWPAGHASTGVRELVDAAFRDPELDETYAVVVVQHGRLLTERYEGALPSFTHAPTPVTVTTPLLSWSMAKSVLHAAIGLLVDEGRIDVDAPAAVPEWSSSDDPRARITVRDLLQMRDGLAWVEDYVDDQVSDVIHMLFGEGKDDVAGFAAARPLAVEPGTRFNYSSGTSNLLARAVGDVVGHGEATRAFLTGRLFTPLGMDDATVTIDAAGTFVGSSYVYCSARSFAKFATLYLRGGVWEGRPLLSREWVDTAQVVTSRDVDPATYYSHHWWLDGEGAYWMSGYEGQRALVHPAKDAVLVRLGRTPAARYPAVRAWCDAVLAALD